jgi:hypothetical protein
MFFVHYIAKSILSRSQTWFKAVAGAPYGDKIDNDCEARKQSEVGAAGVRQAFSVIGETCG